MVKKRWIALFVSSALGVTFATNAYAGPAAGFARPLRLAPPNQFITTTTYTLAPFAFVRFCKDNRSNCDVGRGDAEVTLTPTLRAELLRINSTVNRTIVPKNDDDDVWAQDVTAGDCEDFALTKRHQLIKAGWPTRSLRIAVAKTRAGEGHAVLVVRTSEGDLVLDNRTSAVRTWNQTDLNWIKIQSGDNPRLWYEI
ncbi:transglutaminase-like cysteine peptidase [Neorhizobium sp. LMR1-1-1.1]